MNCPKCQAPVSAKARFCDQCGVGLSENVEFLHQRALDHYHRGLIDEAVKLWDEALAKDSGFSKGYYYKGLALYDRGDLQLAVDAFHKALAEEKEPFRVYFKLGMAQYGL